MSNAAWMKGTKIMITLKHAGTVTAVLFAAGLMQHGITTHAQNATPTCRPAQVIPLTGPEPPPKLVVAAPLPEPLASRGVVVISYCADNMRIAPMFGPGALAVSPRLGHIHVTIDDAPWHWADASGTPLILRGMPPGPSRAAFRSTFQRSRLRQHPGRMRRCGLASAERERECLHAGIKEPDLQRAIRDRPGLPD